MTEVIEACDATLLTHGFRRVGDSLQFERELGGDLDTGAIGELVYWMGQSGFACDFIIRCNESSQSIATDGGLGASLKGIRFGNEFAN